MTTPAPLVRVLAATLLCAAALTVGAGGAAAHEERPATFPDGSGVRPAYLGLDNPRSRVVCTPDSGERIARMDAGPLKRRNRALLDRCRFRSIQDAINTIKRRNTSIYILPGRYEERKWAMKGRSAYCSNLATSSDAPLPSASYVGSITSPETGQANQETQAQSDPIALSYADQRRCAHNLNLIALFGDSTPNNDSITCDSRFCGTQLVGTGRRMGDVLIDNRFAKLNAIRADRMGGVLMRNFTVQQAEFNAVYVLETDGFVVDRLTARANDEYGILAFASDHGLIQRTNTYWNGDSGIYPGSASDLNGDNNRFPVSRYAIEIRHNYAHDNTLGYSGTAGNSVWAHHNRFVDNATGIATDSIFPGHPGLPQDHARWSSNRIGNNNQNFYAEYVDRGVCSKPMPDRGYLQGTVCPVLPVPVGTGILIAGGNFNSTDHNWIYDNWRYGTMQFWVPAPLRDEYDPEKLHDTSHHNHTVANMMGLRPDGTRQHNGLDHWWDDQGEGNCWSDNTYSRGERTDNFTVDPPSCADGGSVWSPGVTPKMSGFLACTQYDRSDPDFRHPPGCTWLDSPSKPAADGSTPPVAARTPSGTADDSTSGPESALALLGLLGVGVLAVRRRRVA